MNYELLDRLLKEKHISRRQLAKMLGIKPTTLQSAFERKSGMDPMIIRQMSEILECSYAQLSMTQDQWEAFVEESRSRFASAFTRAPKEELFTESIALIEKTRKSDLVAAFDKLNSEGQQKAVEYVVDLSGNPKYTKPDEQGE